MKSVIKTKDLDPNMVKWLNTKALQLIAINELKLYTRETITNKWICDTYHLNPINENIKIVENSPFFHVRHDVFSEDYNCKYSILSAAGNFIISYSATFKHINEIILNDSETWCFAYILDNHSHEWKK